MSLKVAKFYKKIAFRVILLYTGIIFLSFLILFFMVYSFFEAYLDNRTKEQLLEKAKSYKILYKQEKLDGLLKQIKKETEILNMSDQFFKVYKDEKEIFTVGEFISIPLKEVIDKKPDYYLFKTINNYYVLIYKLSNRYTLVIGKSTFSNNKLLNRLQDIFFISSTITFFISVIGGLFLTATITRKLKKISETAKDISSSMDLNRRVKTTGSGDEIDDLATVINTLLDRIQILVNTIKETSESIAHDLKTPIARIRSSIENAIIRNNMPKECSDLLGYVLEETEIINQMIADLLTISKIESGAYKLKSEKMNLSESVLKLCQLFKDYGTSKKVKVECDIEENIEIEADPKLLSRAIANLIDNAIKFNMENGKVMISLKREEDKIVIQIEDTGLGIPEDKIDKIFEKFFMVDESRSVYGSGLGLSLVKAVIEAHKGQIKVFSKEGEGTTFKVILPVG
ncbi:MAG: HAMP domain-containing histidine kinase [Hydrogenothermaceae bacterium]|nr:HAMP domain-containing histidine kinase [Hydrogenothermaceae bacterium]